MPKRTNSDDSSDNEDDRIEELIERERSPHRKPQVRLTGLMVQYYHVCKRELWFMSRGIDIDRGAANIRRGTHIDETSYRDKRRSFQINGRIALDMLDSGEVMEVKASSSLEKPARMQLLYYLWYLDRILDIQRDGVLAYPAERKREEVSLTEDNATAVEETIRGIINVVESNTPPKLDKKPYCDSCLYQDICWL
jgi:CRISPR-associated exonuclease Cas4